MTYSNAFFDAEIRAGTIIGAEPFPEARKPAYKLTVDFGDYGIKRSSAQITALYAAEELIGKQILAVVNLGPKRIAGFVSECLVLGVAQDDGAIVLLQTERKVKNGTKVF